MPDFLTPAEQRAIADFDGPVQRIPRGESGYEGFYWNGTQLVSADPEAAKERLRNSTWRGRRQPGPEVIARRKRMAAMVEEGKPRGEIRRALGISWGVLYNDLARMGLYHKKGR